MHSPTPARSGRSRLLEREAELEQIDGALSVAESRLGERWR